MNKITLVNAGYAVGISLNFIGLYNTLTTSEKEIWSNFYITAVGTAIVVASDIIDRTLQKRSRLEYELNDKDPLKL